MQRMLVVPGAVPSAVVAEQPWPWRVPLEPPLKGLLLELSHEQLDLRRVR